jgi:hyperosmotically inducible periplasmic protein
MKIRNFVRGVSYAALSLTVLIASAYAQQPDNSAANKNQGSTADQQKNNPADLDMARQIRQSIMDDKNLSTYAHNVKVIVRNSQVTLKGPVKSDDEKAAIEAKATSITGADKVRNKLTVETET